MVTIIPSKTVSVDDRFGNHYKIITVHHTTGAVSTVDVDNSAMSACEIPDDITVDVGLAKELTTSAGITIADTDATDRKKELTVASAAATGTYIIVVRYIGSAAGLGASGAGA